MELAAAAFQKLNDFDSLVSQLQIVLGVSYKKYCIFWWMWKNLYQVEIFSEQFCSFQRIFVFRSREMSVI